MSRPHVLFVGNNYRYINPTNSHLPAALSRVFDVHFYGPGYVSQDVLEKGVARYVDGIGGVDLIFVTKDFCGRYGVDRLNRFMKRYVVTLNGGVLTHAIYEDVLGYLKANRPHVIGFLTDVDPHAVPKVDLDNFHEHAAFYVTWGTQFLNTLGDAEWVAAEEYMQKKARAGHKLGLLDKFATREARNIISLGFFVSEPEFYWGGLANRPYDAAIPGSAYARRQYFDKALRNDRSLSIASSHYKIVYKIADRLPLRPFSNLYLTHLYNLAFQRMLSRSRTCVTDGGANNYPVRKFFEIPAAGAVLVCPPATGMNALGFADHVHYMPVRESGEAVEIVRAISREPERYEAMASAGRDLALRSHSLAARAEQLQLAVERILAGTFAGSFWDQGRFTCVPAGSAA